MRLGVLGLVTHLLLAASDCPSIADASAKTPWCAPKPAMPLESAPTPALTTEQLSLSPGSAKPIPCVAWTVHAMHGGGPCSQPGRTSFALSPAVGLGAVARLPALPGHGRLRACEHIRSLRPENLGTPVVAAQAPEPMASLSLGWLHRQNQRKPVALFLVQVRHCSWKAPMCLRQASKPLGWRPYHALCLSSYILGRAVLASLSRQVRQLHPWLP
mmetsp:Transcript_15175/g.34591  ORF Transcript_15175/g.34591 Transcript_15175/m.34591 type:complete len:215 (-) Transcript_15175:82-726(-)